ncbi:PREDICTED: ribonucleases P/MRP protein subunit POP1-like [Camelina sativa]|uniref:Ribonucleases P/MRP protein subunit POP1-like n=1 Tax=Camelina sativa TaxID=90675 RepID=A0ABM0YW73_CAMSA|nr:PREDICTED: ribonucleases P/MRP protein subunit POP1-like [Camelina sativa]
MATSTNGNNKRRDVALSSLAPRKINVQKFSEARAAELESLHSIVSDRLNKDFRSKRNKRRRTNSYNNQPAKRRYIKRQNSESLIGRSSGGDHHETTITRRVKRRIELKGNPVSGFSASGDGTKRLRTHVWHAKRFTMTKLWGFHLPLGLHGRGRGSRDVLKQSREGVLVHDASYLIAVQLEGPESSLLSILNMLLEPSPSSHSKEVFDSILTGRSYENAMLYNVNPPVSQAIAPVIYMWRPSELPKRSDEEEDGDCIGTDGAVSNCDHVDFRKLWVWIHASSFSEGYASLQVACQKQMNETGVSVDCVSLEGHLAKLEIFGPKASHLLQKTLRPATSSSEEPSILRKCSMENAEVKFVTDLYKEETISSCAVLAQFVMDPRLIPNSPCDDSTVSVETAKTEPTNSLEITTKTGAEIFTEVFKRLWDANSDLTPPEEENVLCWEKHQNRMDSLCLENPAAEVPKVSSRARSSRSCPLLLLKHKKLGNAPTGWSLILPLSWIKVFWNAFLSKGAHAIGQREKRWVSCDVGLPFFPSDFPDCKAYSTFTLSEAADMEEKAQRRPPAIRPFKIPIPPPWNSIHVTRSIVESSSQNLTSNDETNGTEISSSGGNLFDGIVARTSDSLTTLLQTFRSDNLLLFPHNASKPSTDAIKKTLQEDETKVRAEIHQKSNKLCLVRVLLHAFKEGSFEEGAVVCAPSLADISLLKSSCSEGEEGRVTIPQSSVSSYFQEQPSGTWELNVPEDDTLTKQSHRLPIGFTTTGFVRGSKKQKAEAFCDAVLLGRLRDEQWRNKDVKRRKKETYVLVRNLRSCAFRLALATIVLEQQESSSDVYCF